MDYVKMAKIFERILEKGITVPSDRFTYLIAPYLSDLGYDIYDEDSVLIDTHNGLANVKIKEGLWGQITTEKPYFDEIMEGFPELSIIQYLDIENSLIVMYFKALSTWEVSSEVQLASYGYTNEHIEAFEDIKSILSIGNEAILEDENNLFLTDFVFRNKVMIEGDWYNDYLVTAINNELIEPSDSLIYVIADYISSNYTTMSTDEVFSYIRDGIKEETLYKIIVGMYDLIAREDYVDSSYVNEEYNNQEDYYDDDDEIDLTKF